MADFNGDGIPDVAVSVKSANSVWIYLGRGNGTFSSPAKFPTGASPVQIAVGDVNGDGRADIVALTATGLSALLGNGNGTFKASINTGGASGGTVLALGDLNRDGHLDVIVGGLDPDLEFLGSGDGHFTKTNNPNASGLIESQMLLADLNGDGFLDLVVAGNSFDPDVLTDIGIWWGNGDGTFQPGEFLSAGHSELSVAVGDFNHDGRQDLAAASSYSNSANMLLNLGAKKFAPAVGYNTNPFSLASVVQPGLLASADLTGEDGWIWLSGHRAAFKF